MLGTGFILISLLLSGLWLRKRKLKLDMLSGLVVGNMYFALIPMALAPMVGDIVALGLPVEPFTDASLSLGIYVFFFSISLLFVAQLFDRNLAVSKYIQAGSFPSRFRVSMTEFKVVVLLFVCFTLLVFLNSGKLSGAHWAQHHDAGFIGSLIGLVALTLRAYLFALSIAALKINRKSVLLFLIFSSCLDVILTGNRISVLYLALAVFYSGAFSRISLIVGVFIFAPVLLFLAEFYPAFRGVVWVEFGGFNGFDLAFWYVWDSIGVDPFFQSIYKFFEAANVVVFQYIFENFGQSEPFINGQTVIVKPLTFFIPREFWPEKPLGLGTRLGVDIFGVDGLSINSLLLGEFYANFGWFAPLFIIMTVFIIQLMLVKHGMQDVEQYRYALFMIAFSAWRHEFNYLVFGVVVTIFIKNISKVLSKVKLSNGYS